MVAAPRRGGSLTLLHSNVVTVREAAPAHDGGPDVDAYRRELTAYCYRLLGSGFGAEEAVDETLVRARSATEGSEGPTSVRRWLYRIATDVCLECLRGRRRRALPTELGPPRPPVSSSLTVLLPDGSWVSPIADARVLPLDASPAEQATAQASVRLAFVALLQHLPAHQRVALVLCEVLRWPTFEVAELLDSSVSAVESARQRGQATLASARHTREVVVGDDQAPLLARYADAFERDDIDLLVSLLHDDAIWTMAPHAMWLRGTSDIAHWMRRSVPRARRGSRLVQTAANGCPAFAQYQSDSRGGHFPWALQVLEIRRSDRRHPFLPRG